MTSVLVGMAILTAVLSVHRSAVVDSLERFVVPVETVVRPQVRSLPVSPVAPMAVVGAAVGASFAPGPLLVGVLAGAAAGALFEGSRVRSERRRLAVRLGQELPAVADLLALYVLAGESVVGAAERFCGEATGAAAAELRQVLADVSAGEGFQQAALNAARCSSHPDASRLLALLAEAHRSGARLVESLTMFASERRAAIGRDLTAEGGRRALAGYGPILGLMIPTTLVFLMYPTLTGLDALSRTR